MKEGVVPDTCNSSTKKVEAGGLLWVIQTKSKGLGEEYVQHKTHTCIKIF